MYDIFISYRRDGGHEMARLLYEHLRLKGLKCFFDLEELGSGQFNVKLLDSIEASQNFVLILSPDALDRCQNEGDWVRCEIEHAISCGKNIVPLMLPGFEWPSELPESLAKLPFYNGVVLVREYFGASLDKLIEMLKLDAKSEDTSLQEQTYQAAVLGMKTAKKKKQFEKLAEIFVSLGLYKDSAEKAKECYALAQKMAKRKMLNFFVASWTTLFVLSAVAGVWAFKQTQEDNTHTHSFDQKITTTAYLMRPATCMETAVYYYSCTCGEKGTNTFASGTVIAHTFDQKNTNTTYLKNNATCQTPAEYYYSCSCGEKGTTIFSYGNLLEHVHDQRNTDIAFQKSPATETSPAVYYYSCICGNKGTSTFSSGGVLGHKHTFDQKNTASFYRKSPATCTEVAVYYYSCTCGEKGTSSFTSGTVIPHTFDQKSTASIYRKSLATCTEAAVYYYSCACGEKGSSTFAYGTVIPHTFDQKNTTLTYRKSPATCTAAAVYYYSCTCGEKGTSSFTSGTVIPHAFDQKNTALTYRKSPATCIEAAVYYYSCTCGEKGTNTFASGDTLPHNYASSWTTDSAYHWHECQNNGCTSVSSKIAHIWDEENTCTECKRYKYDGVKFTKLSNGTYEVSDYTGSATEVIIPAVYNGCAVTSIGDYAFRGCSGLISITIPDSVTRIGYSAFEDCSSLTSITIPDSVTFIGDYAFCGCECLSYNQYGNAYYLGNSKNPYLFLAKVERTSSVFDTIYPNTRIIGDFAFSCCSNLVTLTIPDSIESISGWAFAGCSNLTSITIPDSVMRIGDAAFSDCVSLSTIRFSGTKAMWQAISAISEWNSTVTVKCNDGDLIEQ